MVLISVVSEGAWVSGWISDRVIGVAHVVQYFFEFLLAILLALVRLLALLQHDLVLVLIDYFAATLSMVLIARHIYLYYCK